jgi:iron complex transport system ATP-binding protein
VKIEVSGLSFSFGQHKVLKDISLSVAEGEFLGLMGPNGSGKTTLLRCVMNYLPAEAGAILVDMKPLHTLTPRELAKTFAVVPQSSSTNFTFSAYDIVMMGRMPHIKSRFSGETKADEDAVKEAMLLTNTWQFADRPFSELSGGERQRVVVARAVAQRPKALLLDEPTVYLDISGQIEIMDLIRKLNKERGMTIIAVLHDVNLAARYCERIALLSDGRLEAVGHPREVLTPEAMQAVYGIDVVIRKDPFSGSVYVMPRSVTAPPHRHGARVHLLSGGGTGGPIMKALHDRGFSVSTGVLNILDSDYESATDLHLPVVAEGPFTQIGEEAEANNLRMIDESSAIVVSRFPVGPGNFKNLEAARYALDRGKKVFVLREPGGQGIDFIGGRADTYISGLISSGAIPVESVEDLVSSLAEIVR